MLIVVLLLQQLIDHVSEVGETYGLKFNIKRTKFMIIRKSNNLTRSPTIINREIGKIDRISYLGSLIKSQWVRSYEIKCRIENARKAFTKIEPIIRNHSLNNKIRINLIKRYVFPILAVLTLSQNFSKQDQELEVKQGIRVHKNCYRNLE